MKPDRQSVPPRPERPGTRPSRLKLAQLETFAAVAHTGSVSRAAVLLNSTQPPLSRQLAALERSLGLSLFDRGSKGMTLTDVGRRLLEQTEPILHSLRLLEERIRDEQAGTAGSLAVGCVYSNAPLALDMLKDFRTRHPGVELFVRQGTPEDLLEQLKQGRLHVLFLRDLTLPLPGYRSRVLGEDPLELVMCRETDPAPDMDTVPLERLRSTPLCLLPREDPWNYTEHLVLACREAGFEPPTACRCYDTPMAMQLVRMGLGVSFLPRSIVTNHTGSAVYTKPVAGISTVTRPTLVWSGNPCLSPCVQTFLDLVCSRIEPPSGGQPPGGS